MSSPYKFLLPSRNFFFPSKIQKLRVKFCLQRGYPSQILEFRCTRVFVLSWRTLTNTWTFCRRRLILFVQNFPMRLGIIVNPDTCDMTFPINSFHRSSPSSPFPGDVFHVEYISRVSPYVEPQRNSSTTQQIFLSFGERWMNVFQCLFSGFRVKLRCSISFPDHPLPSQCLEQITSHTRITYCFLPYCDSLTTTVDCWLHYKYSVKSLVVLIGIFLHSWAYMVTSPIRAVYWTIFFGCRRARPTHLRVTSFFLKPLLSQPPLIVPSFSHCFDRDFFAFLSIHGDFANTSSVLNDLLCCCDEPELQDNSQGWHQWWMTVSITHGALYHVDRTHTFPVLSTCRHHHLTHINAMSRLFCPRLALLPTKS